MSNINIGDRFGKLVIISTAPNRHNRAMWQVHCDCNTTKVVSAKNLKNRHTTSCGCNRKRPRKIENLLGQKFNRLIVIEKVIIDNKVQWKLQCSCENKTIVGPFKSIRFRSGHTKSCGCLAKETASKNATERNYLTRQYEPIEAASRLVFLAKYNDGTLTFDQFHTMSQMICTYCGKQPSNKRTAINNQSDKSFNKEDSVFIYNGLDRIDNNLPHNIDNCQTACWECNRARRKLPLTDFISHIDLINQNTNRQMPDYISLYNSNVADLSRFYRIKGILYGIYKDLQIDFDLAAFIMSQECFYCKTINSCKTKCHDDKKDVILRNGLDRINQKLPHTLDNCVACCKICNFMKTKQSATQFRSWASRVYDYSIASKLLQY